MIAAALAVEIHRWCVQKGFTIKMPDSVPQNVSSAFAAVIPAFLIILLFNILRMGFAMTDFGSAQTFVLQFCNSHCNLWEELYQPRS